MPTDTRQQAVWDMEDASVRLSRMDVLVAAVLAALSAEDSARADLNSCRAAHANARVLLSMALRSPIDHDAESPLERLLAIHELRQDERTAHAEASKALTLTREKKLARKLAEARLSAWLDEDRLPCPLFDGPHVNSSSDPPIESLIVPTLEEALATTPDPDEQIPVPRVILGRPLNSLKPPLPDRWLKRLAKAGYTTVGDLLAVVDTEVPSQTLEAVLGRIKGMSRDDALTLSESIQDLIGQPRTRDRQTAEPITRTTHLLTLLPCEFRKSASFVLSAAGLVTVGDLLDRAAQCDQLVREGKPFRDEAGCLYQTLRDLKDLPGRIQLLIGDALVDAGLLPVMPPFVGTASPAEPIPRKEEPAPAPRKRRKKG